MDNLYIFLVVPIGCAFYATLWLVGQTVAWMSSMAVDLFYSIFYPYD